jgi:L-alanine-DL-glutamate epimerase-like enolase superfamily enzyme
MKITGIKAIPLYTPARYGGKVSFLLVEVSTDEGITGIGEASDCYGNQIPLASKEIIEGRIKPLIIGEDPLNIEWLWNKMRKELGRTGYEGLATQAISGVEIALWDIIGKKLKQPVCKLLGGYKDKIRVYASTNIGLLGTPLKDQAKETLEFIEEGYDAIKIRTPRTPLTRASKQDETLVRMVRDHVGYDVDLMVDAFMRYTPSAAIKIGKKYEKYELYFFEEPIPQYNLEAFKRLKASVDVPIAAGEHVYTKYGFRELIIKDAVDVFQPDCTVTGGLLESKKICTLADAWGIDCIPHSWNTAVGMVASWHLIASTPSCLMGEYSVIPVHPLRDELLTDPSIVKVEKGHVKIPKKPGLGIEIDQEILTKYARA